MGINSIDQKIFNDVFRKLRKIALVTLRSSKDKGDNYDLFRDTGYDQTNQNAIPVKVITKTISPDSLIHRELGLTKAGALQIILHQKDVELIKNSEKITIDNVEYYVYDDAVGAKFQIFPTQFTSYSKIILFRRDV
jgi:hypothetical protein